MKYNAEISEAKRLKDQYRGFADTRTTRFWSDPELEMFPLSISDQVPDDFQIQKNMLLGKRAEAFFIKAISVQERYEIIAAQIQLINNGITLGELDFILKDQVTKLYYHVELSYKLYLLDSKSSVDLQQWVGPNKRDSLYKKWNKLRSSQFPNIFTKTGIETLKNLNIRPEEIHQAVYMPLQLFLPFGKRVEVDPEFLPSLTGEWMSFTEFQIIDWSGYEFFIPEKQDWFVDPEKCEIWFTKNEIIPSLNDYIRAGNSRMVWVSLPNGTKQKIFVTFWE